jgi:hypothetical protein
VVIIVAVCVCFPTTLLVAQLNGLVQQLLWFVMSRDMFRSALRYLCAPRRPRQIHREIRVNLPITSDYDEARNNFSSNAVTTSKYNVFTFLPR